MNGGMLGALILGSAGGATPILPLNPAWTMDSNAILQTKRIDP
jgi:hypothetical protein